MDAFPTRAAPIPVSPARPPSPPPPDDPALIARVRRGDADACRELVRIHWPAAWRAALAITGRHAMAEDVAQDAFERAFAAMERFDPGRPFAPWLHRIVVNRALDLVRAERRLVGLDAAAALAAWDPDGTGDHTALSALARLSPERRAVVVLRHLLGYTPPQIAGVLAIPEGTVNSRLGRAMAELRDALGPADG